MGAGDVRALGPVSDEAVPGPLTADAVLNAKFRATKFREGYDQDAVDDFLDLVVATLRGDATSPLTAENLAAVRFPVTKFREGYEPDDVDDLLDRVRATFGGGSTEAGPAGDAASTGAPPAPVAPAAAAGVRDDRGALPPGMVDVARRGLFGRRKR